MNKKEALVHILMLFYMIPLGIILTVNMFSSMFQTTYMELYLDTEKPSYKGDSPILILLSAIIFIALCAFYLNKYPVSKKTADIFEKAAVIFAIAICLFIIFLFRVRVSCDSASVSETAVEFLNGDYSSFINNNYMFRQPHQLSLAAFWEIVYYIFGRENYIVLQFINVIAIVSIVYYSHRITKELFDNYNIQAILSLLYIGMLPLYLYATFIYGDIIGIGLMLPAVYWVIRYLNTRKKVILLPAFVCMTLAILLKTNNLVIMAAVIIILLLHLIKEKDLFALVFALVLAIGPTVFSSCIDAYYAKEAGMQLPGGVPKIAWVAMGLQENDYLENGWFNGYNCAVYEACGFDADKTTEACIENIKQSLQSFITSPRHGIKFFYRKFVSQWNDPSFQSQLNVEWNSRHRDDHSSLALYFIYGDGRLLLEQIMNIYHFIVLLGSVVFVVYSIRKTSLSYALLPLCVFGGYFFHMFWEVKGRYALGYFIMCIPMAAYGIWKLALLFQMIPPAVRKVYMKKQA